MGGSSQGGGQSMLRFLRSQRRLGGWVGSVCHVPTAPHAPRHQDPLLAPGRPLVNCDRPVRLLAGESDTVFPPALVRRDVARLKAVGGFTNVQVDVQPGLAHEGFPDKASCSQPVGGFINEMAVAQAVVPPALQRAWFKVPELVFLQRHLATMVGKMARTLPSLRRCPTPEDC